MLNGHHHHWFNYELGVVLLLISGRQNGGHHFSDNIGIFSCSLFFSNKKSRFQGFHTSEWGLSILCCLMSSILLYWAQVGVKCALAAFSVTLTLRPGDHDFLVSNDTPNHTYYWIEWRSLCDNLLASDRDIPCGRAVSIVWPFVSTLSWIYNGFFVPNFWENNYDQL